MNKLLQNTFPDKITNNYSGTRIAFTIFAVITIFTIVRSAIHIFAPDGGAQLIAGFPLETYSVEARNLVVLIFSLWGASQLLLGLLMVLVATKYKSLVPLMYLVILIEYSTRLLIGFYKPAESTHAVPGGIANYLMIPLAGVMLYLSQYSSQKK